MLSTVNEYHAAQTTQTQNLEKGRLDLFYKIDCRAVTRDQNMKDLLYFLFIYLFIHLY